jgi:hypothetical protein
MSRSKHFGRDAGVASCEFGDTRAARRVVQAFGERLAFREKKHRERVSAWTERLVQGIRLVPSHS